MEEKHILARMDALEQKLDLVLEYVNQQRLKSDAIDDLVADVSLIGKDIYNSSVVELENQSVELDPDELRQLGINLLKNIRHFNEMLELLDSMMDLKKDAGPILNELIIEFTKNLHALESKGYFEFARELGAIADNIVTNFTPQDIRLLADNIVLMLQTLKNITQPEMLQAVNNAVKVYGSMQTEDIKPYSVWKAAREMNSPEMKSALGFVIAFMKNMSNTNPKNK
jgi:uncharacterized protein YjgD (DUF1641 family)